MDINGTNWTALAWLGLAFLLVAPALPRLIRNPKALHYIAVWLGIIVVLGLIYRLFGPSLMQ